MRRFLIGFAIAVLAIGLAGCACSTPAPGFAAAGSCASCAPSAQYVAYGAPVAAPCAAGAPAAAPGAMQIPVQMKVGANEYARAGLAIPGNLLKCGGTFLECALQALWPAPTPGLYVVPQATGYVQYAPPAAAPAAPAVQYVPVAAPAAAAPCTAGR
jgi:hypothetical protein